MFRTTAFRFLFGFACVGVLCGGLAFSTPVYGAYQWCFTYTTSSGQRSEQCYSTQENCQIAHEAISKTNPTTITECERKGSADVGTARFSPSSYTVAEDAGSVTITVVREGGDAAVSFDYLTTTGTKSGSTQNWRDTSGTLTWREGDTSPKTFRITIVDDTEPADSDVVLLVLRPASGGAAVSTGSLTITDSERDDANACVDAGYSCKPAGACKTQAPSDAPPCTAASGNVCCAATYINDTCQVNGKTGTCKATNTCRGDSASAAECGNASYATCCVPSNDDGGGDEEKEDPPAPPLGPPPTEIEDPDGGIVPCGDNMKVEFGTNDAGEEVYRYSGECSVCHFQILIKRGLDFLIAFAVACAALLFANAGMLYATASASASNVSKAHKIFTSTLTGLVLILAAYLLIDVFMKGLTTGKFGPWNELLCKDFTPWYEMPKLGKIKLDPDELILPTLECQSSQIGGTCKSACASGESPVSGPKCSDSAQTCCVSANSNSNNYGKICAFTDPEYADKTGNCTFASTCPSDKHSEESATCGSSLVCCHGIVTGQPPADGYCSPDFMRSHGWPEAELAIAGCICAKESGGGKVGAGKTACIPSRCDTCADGTVVSYGIWQINLDVHQLGGNNCPSSIKPDYGTCPKSNVCCKGAKKNCTIVDQDIYNACKTLACDPDFNSSWAANLHAKRGWQPWKTSYNYCKAKGY